MPAEETLHDIVTTVQRLAVIGWSRDPSRPSHDVSSYLVDHGYEVVPVNPRYAGERALDHEVKASLAEVEGPIDAVVVFRRSRDVPEHVDEAIASGAPVFWMQLGIENEEAAKRLREAGLTVVQDRCFKVEHGRFVGGG